MSRRLPYLAALLLVVLLSLGASLVLVPDEAELALIHFRGRQFAEARARFEALVEQGDLSVDVVKPLTELYLQYGDVDRAAELLERFVRRHPADVEARRHLGTLYHYAQRPVEYRLNVESIHDLELSRDTMRELSRIYNASGEHAKQLGLLELLVELYPDHPEDFLDLAYLQARDGRYEDAAATLERFAEVHPGAVTSETIEFEINVLLDRGSAEQARDLAAEWLAREPAPGTVARFAALIAAKGEPELALELVAPFEELASDSPSLLAELIRLQLATGDREAAWRRLDELERNGGLTPGVIPVLVELLLERGQTSRAIAVVRGADIDALPDWLLEGLTQAVARPGHRAYARELLATADRAFLLRHPLIAAELSLSIGDTRSAAGWIDGLRPDGRSAAELLRWASVEERLGHVDRAFARWADLQSRGELPDDALLAWAHAHLRLDRCSVGLHTFETERRRRRTAGAEAAWAVVAAGAGRERHVVRWIEHGPGREADGALLTDLYFIGGDRGLHSLARSSAARLHLRDSADRRARLRLAEAWLLEGRPERALRHFRELLPGTADEESLYIEALLAAREDGGEVDVELRAFLRTKIDDGRLSTTRRGELAVRLTDLGDLLGALPLLAELAREQADPWLHVYLDVARRAGATAEVRPIVLAHLEQPGLAADLREQLVHTLLELGAIADALPHLRRIAFERGGDWSFVYEDALRELGREAEITELWRALARRDDLSHEERSALAFRLLEAGRREDALPLFQELARDAAADADETADLLYLWGETPPAEGLRWLASRARNASGAERAEWMRHLIRVGSPERAVALAQTDPPKPGSGDPVTIVYLEALASAGGGGLDEAIRRELPFENDPGRLAALARVALAADLRASAEPVLERLLEQAPEHRFALKQLALTAFLRADFSRARELFERRLALGDIDWETSYYYGELLERDGRRARAAVHFRYALERLEVARAEGVDPRAARAQLLHRLGRDNEALPLFAELLAEEPGNAHLRADYVGALLERRDFEQARRVLDAARPSEPGSEAGRLRLDLLGAELSIETEGPAEALPRLIELERTHPDAPSVLTSLARVEESVGRWRSAEEILGRAGDLDPRNEEIAEVRRRLLADYASRVRIDFDRRSSEDGERRWVLGLSGQARMSPRVRLGFDLNRADIRTDPTRRADGDIREIDEQAERGELFLLFDRDGGSRMRASLFGGNVGAGAGLAYTRSDLHGRSRAALEIGKPYWDLAAGIADRATRDRLELARRQRFGTRVTGSLGASFNRFDLESQSDVVRSLGVSGELTYTVRPSGPALALQYLLDGEYTSGVRRRIDGFGAAYPLLPLADREVHAADFIVGAEIARDLRADGFAGFSWDRLGGDGLFFGVSLTHDLRQPLAWRVWYEQRLDAIETERVVRHGGAHLLWRFDP